MVILFAMLGLIMTFILVIGLHELGHAIAAWCFSIQIQRVACGFGKPLLKITSRSGCEWVLGRWPVGGAVTLLNTRVQPVPQEQWAVCFDKQAVWIRVMVLLSGGLMNFAVAWCCFFVIHCVGYQLPLAVIDKVTPTSIAASGGLKSGDQLLFFHGESVASWQQASVTLLTSIGYPPFPITVKTKTGKIQHHSLDLATWRPQLSSKTLWAQLGIKPTLRHQQRYSPQPLLHAMKLASTDLVFTVGLFFKLIKQLITGHLPLLMLTGPLSFIELTLQAFLQQGPTFLFFIASCSIAVGIVNLLPIPTLDGGSILYALIEKCRGQPMPVGWEVLLYRLTTILIWILIAQLLANDLRRF
ncbi:MAG: site-2 protease family protein [Gammaproteobacteria bacterium]|nr:site-2 protease family protein [Gammaproteobacteria bacterium]